MNSDDSIFTCPKCGSEKQVWRNQITGKMTCHRYGCHVVSPENTTTVNESQKMKNTPIDLNDKILTGFEEHTFKVLGDHPVGKRPDKTFSGIDAKFLALRYADELVYTGYENVKVIDVSSDFVPVCSFKKNVGCQSDTAICPECGVEMPITAEHNGVAWVGHGICHKCGWASQHALPDDFTPNSNNGSPVGEAISKISPMRVEPWDLKAADGMAKIIDEMVERGELSSRSPLADARLSYGNVGEYKFTPHREIEGKTNE